MFLLLTLFASVLGQSCTRYNNVVVTNWTVIVAPDKLQAGQFFVKKMPAIFTTQCNPTYSLTWNGGPVPEFIKPQFSKMQLSFGSMQAVDIFGIDALYGYYELDYVGIIEEEGASTRVKFTVNFINPLVNQSYTMQQKLGFLKYNQYLEQNPDPWNDGFIYGSHSLLPYEASPFNLAKLKVVYTKYQLPQYQRIEKALSKFQAIPVNDQQIEKTYSQSFQPQNGFKDANLIEQLPLPQFTQIDNQGLVTITFTNKIVYSQRQWPLQVVSSDQIVNITADEYFLSFLKDTRSLQVVAIPSSEMTVGKLQVDFDIVSITQSQLICQLRFTDPEYVSFGYDPDLIQFSFHNTRQWLTTNKQFYVPEGYFIQKELPPQKTKVILEDQEIIYYVGAAFIISNLVILITTYLQIDDVWSMVNSFQISSHLPLLDFPIAYNSLAAFRTFKRISCFDYLEADTMYANFQFTAGAPWSKTFDWMGYTTTNFLMNLSSLWFFYTIVFAQAILLLVSNYSGARQIVLDQMNLNLMGWFIKLTNARLWLMLALILMIETFYEVFLVSIIGLKTFTITPSVTFNRSDQFSIASNFLWWLLLLTFLLTTLWFALKIRKVQRVVTDKQDSHNLGELVQQRSPRAYQNLQKLYKLSHKLGDWSTKHYERLKELIQPDATQSLISNTLVDTFNRAVDADKRHASFTIPIFIMRRILLIFIALFAQEYPAVQLHLFLIISWWQLAFLTIVRPYSYTKVTVFEICNELVVLIVGYHCLAQLLVNDVYGRQAIGYSVEVCLWFQLASSILTVGVLRVVHFIKWARYKIRFQIITVRIKRAERKKKLIELQRATFKKEEAVAQQNEEEYYDEEDEEPLNSESDLTPEEEEPLPIELQSFTQEQPTHLFELMKKKVQETKDREEEQRAREEAMLKTRKVIKFLKEDAKSHLDTLFEDLHAHVKNFA